MAGQNPPYYTPTSKPTALNNNSNPWKKANLYSLVGITFLCSVSYLLGAWQRGCATTSSSTTSSIVATINCLPSKNTTTTSFSAIDFKTHHSFDSNEQESINLSEEKLKTYPPCDVKYSEYTPCEHQERSLQFNRNRLIYRERHCPKKNDLMKCRIPAPHGYRNPFKWPMSRDVVWYNNVPHKELTVEKAVQNWIRFEGDRFRFPGGGTMFPNGADAYIDDIGNFINLKDGSIRTAIDTGCGVASWGAYLMSRNIVAMSFAPRDTHEAQVQFALERGVPALIGVLASKRLPYPSRSFDMAHCSRCLIPWGQYELDGEYLIEVDRVLRPGGYWILSGPPIHWRKHWRGWERTREDLNSEQTQIETITNGLCWKKVIEKDDIAIWQKPTNHINCKKFKRVYKTPPFCPPHHHPDKAWYTSLKTCLTPLPDVENNREVAGGKLEKWPRRLNAIPPRITLGTVEGFSPEAFQQDSELWIKRVKYYKTVNSQLDISGRYRNVLDMNAFLGGFAAALVDYPLWVMNVVPVEAKVNTLGVIYERGLIGTYQNWCEAMSTYPRTYDLIHSGSIFTLYNERCEMEDIMLEMDRILRPEGSLIIRDDVDILIKVKQIADKLQWESQIVDHEDGPLEREKLLFAVKSYWTAPSSSDQQQS